MSEPGRHRRQKHAASRRRAAAVVVTVLTPAAATLGAPAAVAAPGAGGADANTGFSSFSGAATADGIRITVAVKDYLIVEDFIDGGGPTASAVLNSLGESTAFSSLPYPGAIGVAFPGLISTLSGKSVPGYPFIVNSQFPSQPEAKVSQPGYLMQAQSSPTRSVAQTTAGASTANGEEFGSFSTAAVDSAGTAIVSKGESRTRLAIGALALNGAISKASVTRTPDGKVVKDASFEASSIRLGDTQIGVTDEGLVLGPQTASADPANQLTQAFTSSGVTVTFLPEVETEDSVLSSGLEISTAAPIPNLGNAKGVVSYVVGRTFAQAQSVGLGSTASGVTPAATAAGVPAAVPAPAGTDDIGTAVSLPPPTAPGLVPAPTADSLVVTGLRFPPQQAVPPTVDLVTASGATRPLTELSFYPLLAALVPILLLAAVGARRFV